VSIGQLDAELGAVAGGRIVGDNGVQVQVRTPRRGLTGRNTAVRVKAVQPGGQFPSAQSATTLANGATMRDRSAPVVR
jgi:hypothetical protein